MDELNKKIKKKLNKMNSSEQYKKMIEDTMKMISNNEIERDDHNVFSCCNIYNICIRSYCLWWSYTES